MVIGTSMFAAQYWGRQDRESIRRIMGFTMRTTFLAGALFWGAAWLVPEPLMRMFTRDVRLADLGTVYLGVVGNALGAGKLEQARKDGAYLCRMSLVSGLVTGAFLLAMLPVVLELADISRQAREYLGPMLVICSYYLVGKSVNSMTIGGIFCAGGDSRFGLICDIVTLWCFTVPMDALNLGLDELCFTDHVDYGVKPDWDSGEEIRYRGGKPLANVDYPRYVDTIRRMQQMYGDRTQQEYNERYYEEMLNLVNHYQDYSVLGHMDLIVRYDEQGVYPFPKVKPYVEKILRRVIRNGKGIEFNTSFHRYGLADTTPSREILQLYRELGGRIITLGSDSHRPEHLGAYIREGKEVLKSLGFKEFCTYEGMEPVFHSL